MKKRLIHNLSKTALLAIFTLIVSAVSISAATFTVTNTNDSGAGSLRQAIADAKAAAGADTVVFDATFNTPQTITLANSIPNYDSPDPLTITGPGANLLTVKGNDTFRIFTLFFGTTVTPTSEVFLSGMTISNGRDTFFGGGGIFVQFGKVSLTNVTVTANSGGGGAGIALYNGATLTAVNSTISNNTSNIQGGGIWAIQSSTINLTNTTISGNTAPVGGGIQAENNATVTINGSTITNNIVATGTGGGISISGATLNMTNTTVSSNFANNGGGGLFLNGTATITNCNINDNSTFRGDTFGGLGGGGIAGVSVNLTITGSTLNNNSSNRIGGAITMGGNGATTLNITDSFITNNNVNNGTEAGLGGGGGLNLNGNNTATISGTTISGNFILTPASGSDNGGGIVTGGELTLTNSMVTGNMATGSGGGIFSGSESPININGSTISGNTADSDNNNTGVGGGLFTSLGTGNVPDATTTITNSTISGNTVLGNSRNGGGIHSERRLNMTNSTVSGNSASTGAGIYMSGHNGPRTLDFINVTVANNTATGQGGGFRFLNSFGNVTINLRNSIFADNTAGTNPDLDGPFNSNGFNLIEDTTGATITGDTATNITGVDPLLGLLQANGGPTFTHALLMGSPAIDKGNSSGSTTDQRMETRPVDKPTIPNAAGGDGADIGAFEDQPIVMFSTHTYNVNEPDLVATITVLRSGGTEGIDTVDYATSMTTNLGEPPATGGASCTEGVDYINTSGTLTFNEGVASQTFDVTICNDTLVEGLEIFRVDLSNPSGKTLGNQSFAIVVITSEDVFIPQRPMFDFDGDGKTDLAVFRPMADPNLFDFAIRQSSNNALAGYSWGLPGDKLAPGDYDGDGRTDVAVYREGSQSTFYILRSSDKQVVIDNFGITGDVLTVGDWDGDGKDDVSVYREGTQSVFYFRGSNNNPNGDTSFISFGTTGDKPMRGDFDGDGIQDAAVFRPSNATWYIRNSSDGSFRYENWGLATDKFVPADYDGDGKTDLAVWRPSNGVWYIWQSSNNQPRYIQFGLSTDKLVPADYDGDGKVDEAVYRNGIWYLNQSTSGFSAQTYGQSGDTPIPNAYVNP